MPERVKKEKSKATRTPTRRNRPTRLSPRTKKQIDSLPEHAQEIYKEAHANALQQYQKPEKGAAARDKVLKKWLIRLHGQP